MKLIVTKSNILCSLLTPLLFTNLISSAVAQAPALDEKSMLAEDKSELLKKGNTWNYSVKLRVPDSVEFKPSFKDQGEKVKNGTLYKYEEKQQSEGLKYIDVIERKAPHINLYVDSKTCVLDNVEST